MFDLGWNAHSLTLVRPLVRGVTTTNATTDTSIGIIAIDAYDVKSDEIGGRNILSLTGSELISCLLNLYAAGE